MASEKASKKHFEHGTSNSDNDPEYYKSKSTKQVIAALIRSMFLCTATSPTWEPSHKRSDYERSIHHNQQSQRLDIISLFSTLYRRNVSQVSVITLSVKGSLKFAPEKTTNCVTTSTTSAASAASPSARGIYHRMPHHDSIRLLRVHKGSLSDTIQITLEFARLNATVPEYEALSYFWGSSVTVSHIFDKTTHTPIPVTRNLYDALKSVRQVEVDRVMWVDALCINQSDGKEKGTQVCKMNHIYTSAARVIVWLGPDEDDDADGAFGVLCSLANTEGESASYQARSPDDVPHVPDHVPEIRDYDAWKKVMMFFCQTWFTRLWVLQEIVLAQDAEFVWGNCSISWTFVGAAIRRICKMDLIRSLLQTRNLQNALLMWHLSSVFRNARVEAQSTGDTSVERPGLFPFLNLLDIARSFDVTDPRDKVYGLFGFPTLNDDMHTKSITPDYSLSAAEVYTNTTRSCIAKAQNLDILAHISHTAPECQQTLEQINNLPSWVPDFNSKATIASISSINTGHQYSAGLSRPLHCQLSTNPQMLRLEGVTLDSITRTGPSIPFLPTHEFHHYLKALVQWYITSDANLTTHDLAMLLTGGRDMEGRLLSPAQSANCAAFLSRIVQSLTPNSSTNMETPEFSAGLTWQDNIKRFTTYRAPFLTATGKVGLGPQGLQEGDRVVVLWGGQCPFVVREVGGGRWVLKGECLVKEWMNGSKDGFTGGEGEVFHFV